MYNALLLGGAVAPSMDLSALQTSFTGALTSIQTSAMGFIASALPVGLAIMAAFLVVRIGIKFFKSIAR